jgi:hypothetical protein
MDKGAFHPQVAAERDQEDIRGCFASRAGSGQSGYEGAYGMRGVFKAIQQGQLGNPRHWAVTISIDIETERWRMKRFHPPRL